MFGFLQGFVYGLFLSCPAWLVVGLIDPHRAVPTEPARRWHVLLRYALLYPFLAFVLWLTSLFGGFGPTVGGWIAGLVAIAVAIPAERTLRRALTRRREQQAAGAREARRTAREQSARETGVSELDPARPPHDADDLTAALCRSKAALIELQRHDLTVQIDRVHARYRHVMDVLRGCFEPHEVTFERSRGLVREVCWTAVDRLDRMASLARGAAGIDGDYVRRRLARAGMQLGDEERRALERRLELIEETEARLAALSAQNEAAITALDDAAVALAAVSTEQPRASVAADQALSDLHRFIDQAHRYDRQGSTDGQPQ